MYNVEEYDKQKTKVLKYVLYKKRTEKEILTKFSNSIEENMLEDIIQELKQNKYVSDKKYVERAVSEYIALKNLSIKELKYKLVSKGISTNLIDEYINQNEEEIEKYEKQSAENIAMKKSVNMDEIDIKNYLIKKGYKEENIKDALSKIEE